MADAHLIVNVEAGLARKISEEAARLSAEADELLAQASAAASDDETRKAHAAAAAKRQQAERTRELARQAVATALSLDDDTPPEQLEPIRRVPITDEEQAEQQTNAEQGAWTNLRATRNGLLRESDWTQLADVDIDQEAWAAYRQQLRDLPAEIDDPTDIDWPRAPNA
jgi:Phage tail assembly chaperone protein